MHFPPFYTCPEAAKTKNSGLNQHTVPWLQCCRIKQILLEASPQHVGRIKQLISDIHSKASILSFRLVEWGVFNYAKANQSIVINDSGDGQYQTVNVHQTYLAWRRNYKRKLFDPFCRTAKVYFLNKMGHVVCTTAAQINFFYFLVIDNIDGFLIKNLQEIKQHQKKTRELRQQFVKGRDKKQAKRKLLISTSVMDPVFIKGAKQTIINGKQNIRA